MTRKFCFKKTKISLFRSLLLQLCLNNFKVSTSGYKQRYISAHIVKLKIVYTFLSCCFFLSYNISTLFLCLYYYFKYSRCAVPRKKGVLNILFLRNGKMKLFKNMFEVYEYAYVIQLNEYAWFWLGFVFLEKPLRK